MKNKIAMTILCGIITGKTIFAVGGVELLTNTTVGAIGNTVMQTSISAESVFYNPAATSFLENGDYFYVGSYLAGIDYKMEVGSVDLESTTPQIIPSFSYVMKNNRQSYYFGLGLNGQGGKLKIDNNIPFLENMEATIIHGGLNFGVSYLLSDNLSVSFGGVGNYSKIELTGNLGDNSIKNTKDSKSLTFETGIFYRATEKLSFSGKYLNRTKQDYGGYLAGMVSLGTSYKLTEKDQINMGYNIILEENDYSNSYEYAVSLERQINSKLSLSLGYMYSDRGSNRDGVYTFTELSSHQVGFGGEYSIKENMVLGFGVGLIDYKEKSSKLFNSDVKSMRNEKIVGLSLKVKL